MNQRQFSEKFFDLDKLDLKDPSIYKTSFQGSQKPYEFYTAWDRIDKYFQTNPTNKITFLEIGAYRGLWSEALMAYSLYRNLDIHYSTITLMSHDSYNQDLYKMQNKYHDKKYQFDLIDGSSLQQSSYNKLPLTEYNIVFIDGDHSYKAVMSDNKMYCPLATDIILWHDVIGLKDVSQAIEDSSIHLDEVIGFDEGKTSMGIGIKYVK